ncbi:MAG TPA: HAD family hydrolase [Phycisphaerales bacterium]|nr:HAD family hydrolase [Phycisphaerales bacterium]
MNIDMEKIYISDLDGTLLQDDACLSPYARKTLSALIENGVNFTVASARSLASVRQILHGIPFRLPVIGLNGAYISDFATGEHLFINDIDESLASAIYALARKHHCWPFVSTFSGTEDRVYYQRLANDGMLWFHDNRMSCKDNSVHHAKNIEEKFSEKIVSFAIVNTYEKLKPLSDQLQADFADTIETHLFENLYSPSWWWITIQDKKACKSIAIKTLAKYAGFQMENVTVFGDRSNDLEMFKVAKTSIAVENAVDEIKKHATKIIGTNQNDSVVKYISARS